MSDDSVVVVVAVVVVIMVVVMLQSAQKWVFLTFDREKNTSRGPSEPFETPLYTPSSPWWWWCRWWW